VIVWKKCNELFTHPVIERGCRIGSKKLGHWNIHRSSRSETFFNFIYGIWFFNHAERFIVVQEIYFTGAIRIWSQESRHQCGNKWENKYGWHNSEMLSPGFLCEIDETLSRSLSFSRQTVTMYFFDPRNYAIDRSFNSPILLSEKLPILLGGSTSNVRFLIRFRN
jgi:hypothetical protein